MILMIPSLRKDVAAVCAVIFLAIGLVACGGDDGTTETADDSTGASVAESTETGTETETGAGSAAESDDGTSVAGDEQTDADDRSDADGGIDGTGTVAAVDSAYLGSYTLVDEEFGTMVTVAVDGQTRSIETNAIPDHETGEFPNSGNPNTISEQDLSYEYPLQGNYTGDATFAMVPGVAVNGVSFEPGTGESVSCDSGETYRIEALQDLYNLGLDFNNAHVQPGGKYHYHGVSDLLVNAYASDDDLVHVGFAADGFLMYYSKSEAYTSSYQLATDARTGTDCVASGPAGGDGVDLVGTAPDGTYVSDWAYVDGAGDLDSCNGTMIDGTYAYIITNEYPYISRCLNGEYAGGGPGSGAPPDAGGDESAAPAAGATPTGGPGAAPAGGSDRGAPDLSAAAEALGVTVEALEDALGGPPPDFAAAAEALGVTVEELTAVVPTP